MTSLPATSPRPSCAPEFEFYSAQRRCRRRHLRRTAEQPVLTAAFDPRRSAATCRRHQALEAAAEALRSGDVASLRRVPRGRRLRGDGLAAPVRDATLPPPGVAGAVVVHLDAADTLFPTLESWPASMRTGRERGRRGGGRQDRHSSIRLTVGRRQAAHRLATPSAADLPAAMAVRGRSGVVEDGLPRRACAGRGRRNRGDAVRTWWPVAPGGDRPAHVDRGWATLAWVAGLILLAGVVLLLYCRASARRARCGASWSSRATVPRPDAGTRR